MSSQLPSYTTAWALSGYQKNTITCLSISPTGTRLIVASEDNNLLLVNFEDGAVLLILCFEDQFSVLCALWYSESNLLIGCSNGSLYDVCFDPTDSNYAVTMHPFLHRMPQQVRSLAYDPSQSKLAVGFGNTVTLYDRDDDKTTPSWSQKEIIKGPANNRSALVHALLFYPGIQAQNSLLVAYAEAGFNVWSGHGKVTRISPSSNHNVCRVGRATLSPDNKFIAISTLDHTIVIYPLSKSGPVLSGMKEYPYEDRADFVPTVPVAFTSDGLALGGTACGDVPMIQAEGGEMPLIRHEEGGHIVRAIATHGKTIVVGSTCFTQSVVKCYSPSVVVRSKGANHIGEPRRVTVTEAIKGWNVCDSRWPAQEVHPVNMDWHLSMKRATLIKLAAIATLLVLVLSAEPPGGPSFQAARKESDDTDVLKPTLKGHEYWVLFGVRHFSQYLLFQCGAWILWVVRATGTFASNVARVVPGAAELVGLGVAKWICERVEVYRELGVCPKLEY